MSLFITLEGVDGAGKSTHIPTIANLLKARALLEEAGWKLDDAGVLRLGSLEHLSDEDWHD